MASTEVEAHSEPLKFKTWVLKVSIHCEGCKKKVKKIINSVPGVYNIDIDAKQNRVVVTGNVEADALLRKLLKSGKHAELLLPDKPTQTEKNPDKAPAIKKEKPNIEDHGNSSKDISQAKEVKKPPPATSKPEAPAAQDSTKMNQSAACGGGAVSSAKNIEDTSASTVSGSGGAKVTDAAGESTGAGKVVDESKVEEKKPETDSAGKEIFPPSVELKGGETESVCAEKSGSGNVGKKKKKKGQNGNSVVAEPSSALPASAGSPNDDNGGPPRPTVSSNDSPPRHYYGYQYPPPGPPVPPSHYYATPPAPAYAVNYNTAQPSSSYTASYYASPPPQSYAYSYPGQEMGPPPPPSDYDSYQRQPLDSFEMFSDENPNGCSVM